MRVIIDAHIHSKYSRATSQNMDIRSIARFAQIKGLTVVGTGDFTHPKWLEEIKEALEENPPHSGLYKLKKSEEAGVYFILTAEVSTVFEFEGRGRKVHHVIWCPNIEIAEQINDSLSNYGSLTDDGRPTLTISAPQLVEEVLNISGGNFIFPAHAWTPWFSIFGAFSGFDNVEACYQDKSSRIHALETGLSSDPPMNWRVSSLDRLAIISNSDCHSAWPWRLGREATVLELEELSYLKIVEAIKSKDPKRLLFTIETDPAYGKYHWTGHRNCNVSMPPEDAIRQGGRCPVCGGRMTKGVQQRVEELADRPPDYRPKGAPGYVHLLPLSEIIGAAIGAESPASQRVWDQYNLLIEKFGNEYNVLLDATTEELSRIVGPKVADLLSRMREGKLKVIPGYDGVYGRLELGNGFIKAPKRKTKGGRTLLSDFL
ncbi:MAG: endonuclease Q family protein [Candidatus Bathyarchaeia archaeon]